ncbi:GSU2403 family nucleotidyltransferase fold protein [Paraburkholderia unamae]|uniref:GSU2403 family nucleotidyltransferase fold protein n=1 Tax=Paraburkholderia unamae TaxID=219649 RepID=A0ACC6RXQ5_9BURK
MSDLADFTRLAVTLEPWRHQIVFVGGWAYRLYRYEPRAYTPEYEAVFTQDADVAYKEREALEGNLKEALIGAGFEEKLNGDFKPPAARYTLGDEANGFYAEFLTPLSGSGKKRNKQTGEFEEDATVVNGGVIAQKLRYLEVLLHAPWVVNIPAAESGINEEVAGLRIPNPVSFIIQKLLIRDRRAADKRPQDVLYIHDAIELFGASIDELAPIWKDLEATLTGKQRRLVSDGVAELFSEVNDTLREAAIIPSDRQPDPEDMLKLCQFGFGKIFDMKS